MSTVTAPSTEEPLTELFAFVGAAGYSIVEIVEYLPEGKVRVIGERPVNRLRHELVTTTYHLTIHIS